MLKKYDNYLNNLNLKKIYINQPVSQTSNLINSNKKNI